jgi:hypothetical protein
MQDRNAARSEEFARLANRLAFLRQAVIYKVCWKLIYDY